MASIRTYIPGIIALVRLACRYMDRYGAKLRENLPEEQRGVYDALHTACDAFEAIIPLIQPAEGD
jgi:hypothetical protein